jgi:hypothetical protein
VSSRLTRASGFRQAVTTVASPSIVAAFRLSAISIEPSWIAARSTTASISRRLSVANAITGDEAIATGYAQTTRLTGMQRSALGRADPGVLVITDDADADAFVGFAESRGEIAGNPISLSAKCAEDRGGSTSVLNPRWRQAFEVPREPLPRHRGQEPSQLTRQGRSDLR